MKNPHQKHLAGPHVDTVPSMINRLSHRYLLKRNKTILHHWKPLKVRQHLTRNPRQLNLKLWTRPQLRTDHSEACQLDACQWTQITQTKPNKADQSETNTSAMYGRTNIGTPKEGYREAKTLNNIEFENIIPLPGRHNEKNYAQYEIFQLGTERA